MSNENDPKAIREEIEATRERISDTAEALAYKSDVPARVKDKVSARVEGAKSAVSDAATSVSAKLADVSGATKSNMQDLTESAKSGLAGAADSARSAVGNVADAAKERFGSQSSSTDLAQHMRDDAGATNGDSGGPIAALTGNPLALGIASIAAGFLVGLAIPVSDVERDNVGPIGERVASEAKAKASDLAEQGKAAVVSAVTDTFTQSSSSKAGP